MNTCIFMVRCFHFHFLILGKKVVKLKLASTYLMGLMLKLLCAGSPSKPSLCIYTEGVYSMLLFSSSLLK